MLKRLIDICLSAVAIVVLLPLLAVVAILVQADQLDVVADRLLFLVVLGTNRRQLLPRRDVLGHQADNPLQDRDGPLRIPVPGGA